MILIRSLGHKKCGLHRTPDPRHDGGGFSVVIEFRGRRRGQGDRRVCRPLGPTGHEGWSAGDRKTGAAGGSVMTPAFGMRRRPADAVVVQAVCGELVSGAGAAISLLNREKTGNFSVFGQYNGIFGRINSSNQ